MKRVFAFVLVVTALLFVALPATAQRIVLLRPRTADPALAEAFGRLKGELLTYDFEVIVIEAGDVTPTPPELARAAEQARAVASISLVRSQGLATADVWISDRVTGKTTMRTIATAEGREASGVLAVRAVDLLRTSLRELGPGDRPPPEVVGARPERAPARVREWATGEPRRRLWWVEAAFVLQSTLSTLGAVYGPSISIGASPLERVDLDISFQGPLSGAEASLNGAKVSLQTQQLFAELRYRPIARTRWAVEATASAGAHRFEVDGNAQAPYIGRSDSALTALVAPGVGLELRLLPSALLVASGRAVFLAPRPVVRAAGTEVAYGRPALQAGAGLRVEF
jgi:hypothetical protein